MYISGDPTHLPRWGVRARGVVVQLLASKHQVLMMKWRDKLFTMESMGRAAQK